MERATLIEMIEAGGCAGLDVAILEALGLEYNGEVLDSLDAAVALVERVRPEAYWSAAKVGPQFRANVVEPSVIRLGNIPPPHTTAPTPAAALVAALLKASEP